MRKLPPRLALAGLALLWLAPAVLLIRRNSFWTPVALVGFACTFAAVGPTRRKPQRAADSPSAAGPDLITPPPDPPPLRPTLRLTAAGAFINLALLGQGTGRPIAAGMFAAAATGFLLAGFSRPRREAFVIRHAAASVRLAALLLVIGIIRWGVHRLVPDYGEPDAVEASSQPSAPRQLANFRGVVLFVAKPKDELAAPPPPDPLRHGAAEERKREPLVIPFSGAYWLFRRPDSRPPSGSLIRYGEPDHLFFRADDGIPLRMEAHQHIGRYLPLSCCQSLEVELTSTDRFANRGVQAEVLLVDTATQGNQSLGTQPVPAPPIRFDGITPPPVEARLTFPIRPGRLLRFDRISVRFHLSRPRATQSARVAIRRFTLRP